MTLPSRPNNSLDEKKLPAAELAMKWSCCGAFGWLFGLGVMGLVLAVTNGKAPSSIPPGSWAELALICLTWCWVFAWPLFSLAALPYASFLTFRAFWEPESQKQRWYAMAINFLAWGLGGLPSLVVLAFAAEGILS
jgi:hypothetical protein